MKILYVSQYFPPEMGAPAARVHELAREWAAEGHDVTVLTGFPNHPAGVVHPEYKKHLKKLVYRERIDGINVVRTLLAPLPNRKSWERILNYTSFALSAAVTGSFLKRPDVIIATSPQLLVGMSGWWIGKAKRAPLIFEVRDLWPESIAAAGMGNETSFAYRSLKWVAGFLYRNARKIVVVTPAFKTSLIDDWSVPAEKISIVLNGVDTSLFNGRPSSADQSLQSSPENQKFIASYIGTMGAAHGLNTILDAADSVQHVQRDIEFVFVGEGAEKARLQRVVVERGIPNVRFLPQQPRETIPGFIRSSDVCLVLLKKADTFKTVIPTKMLEFMACERPVVLGVEGQAKEIMDSANAGLCIEPENADDLLKAIIRLKEDKDLRVSLGINGSDYINGNASRSQTARAYLEILRQLLAEGD
jgi:colanic acid biosynthesis glycosyl transferase WcaI